MEILEREIKKNNATLTSRNKLLHNSYLEPREMYSFLKRLNKRYLKENTRMYRIIRFQRLHIKDQFWATMNSSRTKYKDEGR